MISAIANSAITHSYLLASDGLKISEKIVHQICQSCNNQEISTSGGEGFWSTVFLPVAGAEEVD